ncbi:hypothetical protein BKA70DRAFT_862309 [Coprinopsis sp. MPI-PUGE-AT-0042]|nr:hypothetical protein BKA70DRAFT_862309 [Coprinopsis sp. MPI-PUGE-AT-0042]
MKACRICCCPVLSGRLSMGAWGFSLPVYLLSTRTTARLSVETRVEASKTDRRPQHGRWHPSAFVKLPRLYSYVVSILNGHLSKEFSWRTMEAIFTAKGNLTTTRKRNRMRSTRK